MPVRQDITNRFIVGGKPYFINLIHNPTIDDVIVTEARISAAEIENGPIEEGRRVTRDIREFLIRLGVER